MQRCAVHATQTTRQAVRNHEGNQAERDEEMSDKIKDGGPAFPTVDANRAEDYGTYGMTLRQYAAINLRVPNSGTDWLDEMIRQSVRGELAAKAMQTLISCVWDDCGDTDYIVDNDSRLSLHLRSYEHADAMLKAQEIE